MKFLAVSTRLKSNRSRPSQNILAKAVFDVLSEGANSDTGSMLPKPFQRIIVEKYRGLARKMCGQTHSLGHSVTFEVPLDPSLIAK
jgi:hypothetical protein